MRVSVQAEDFELGAELSRLAQGRTDVGAVVSFTGWVRDDGAGLVALEIEHYPGMAERAIVALVARAIARWDLVDACVIHRFGALPVGAQIMMVATAARHRADAFAAAEFLMDFLKSRAPFWKKEVTAQGGGEWIAAKATDEAALGRWGATPQRSGGIFPGAGPKALASLSEGCTKK